MSNFYYIAMVNWSPASDEATVNPDESRADIVRNIVDGQYDVERRSTDFRYAKGLVWVHEVDIASGTVKDVTLDLLQDAIALAVEEGSSLTDQVFELCQSLKLIETGYCALTNGRLAA